MHFIFFFQAAQDGDRILHARLLDEDRLEAPGQRRVLLHVLAIFIQRGRADTVQLPARQRRFEEVGGVHRPVRLPGADQGVHLVDEQDDLAFRGLDLGEHGLQPFLELAAEFRAGDQRSHVQRQQLLVGQAFGHVAIDDAQGHALRNGGLADARLADQHRIVLGAAGQHLDGAADFLVAPDHRVQLALTRGLGQVAGVFLQGVIALFRAGGIGGAALADLVDRVVQRLGRDVRLFQRLMRLGARHDGQRLQDALGGREAVPGLVGGFLRGLQNLGGLGRHVEFAGPVALHFGKGVQRGIGEVQRLFGAAAGRARQIGSQTVLVLDQRLQQMLWRELLMRCSQGEPLRRLQQAARALGKAFHIHIVSIP